MAAEILLDGVLREPGAAASMRPRRMAAEIGCASCPTTRRSRCFNEAAANGRGNLPSPTSTSRARGGFNEAAANGRGNLRVHDARHGARQSFNEAAANGRGNHASPMPSGGWSNRLQ